MHKIMVLGESGTGKTSSLRNLNPKETAIINPDKKSLPLQNWRKNYVWVKKPDGTTDMDRTNYIELDKPAHILRALQEFEKRDDIKVIVIDTITHIITANYMNDTIGKDFKAYQSLGLNAYKLFDFIRDSKKTIIVFGHTDETFNDMGQRKIEMRAYGKMIKDMAPPSFFTTVLMTEVQTTDEGRQYLFRTQSLGPDPAKSPAIFGQKGEVSTALPMYIPNDIALVIEKLNEFEGLTDK